jgi:hypothetical protein
MRWLRLNVDWPKDSLRGIGAIAGAAGQAAGTAGLMGAGPDWAQLFPSSSTSVPGTVTSDAGAPYAGSAFGPGG